jgi:biotin synthase
MVGLPGQTPDHLLADLQFFVDMDVDMIGMGPYIPHPQTPMGREPSASQVDPWVHTLKVMALTRILMPDINMVASTALQSLRPDGLKWGLRAGANVVMPILTPIKYREDYRLYADKKYKPFPQLKEEIEEAGFRLGLWQWGDSLRWAKRQQQSEDNKVAGHLQAEEAM